MLKNIFKYGIFISGLFLIIFLIDLRFDYNIVTHYKLQYDEVYNHRINADAIIIGSSHGTHGINPKYLDGLDGLKFYNFALNGSNPSYYLQWYENVFKPNYKKPKLIIYAVDWFMFDKDWLWRRYEQDSIYFSFGLFLKELFNIHHDLKSKITIVYNRYNIIRERDNLQYLFSQFHDTNGILDTEYYYDGFIPDENKFNGTDIYNYNIKTDSKFKQDFIKLFNEIKHDNIKIIFLNTPEYILGRKSSSLNKNLTYLKEFALKNNVPFLSYNSVKITNINYDHTCYSDWGHMNTKGSTEFSKMLRKDLEPIIKNWDDGRTKQSNKNN
jgi:hypothetical protein